MTLKDYKEYENLKNEDYDYEAIVKNVYDSLILLSPEFDFSIVRDLVLNILQNQGYIKRNNYVINFDTEGYFNTRYHVYECDWENNRKLIRKFKTKCEAANYCEQCLNYSNGKCYT
jgi:hypothetical protein